MSSRKPLLLSTFGSPSSSNRSNKLQRTNSYSSDEEFENSQKRRKMANFKFRASQTSTQLSQDSDVFALEGNPKDDEPITLQRNQTDEEPKSNLEEKAVKYKPKPFSAPSKVEEPTDPIDAYFAAMQRKNPVYARDRPNPEAKIKPVFTAKTSLAGLPSAIPSRPLKENKAKVVPNYIKKAKKDIDDYDQDEVSEEKESVSSSNYRPVFTAKTSLAGLPSAMPSRPLKENKAKVVPNYIKKARNYSDDYDDEAEERPKKCFVKPQPPPQRTEPEEKPNPFKTASRQHALNVAKKNGGQQRRPGGAGGGVYNSFKSPLLQSEQNEGPSESEPQIDERLKNIDPKFIELIENEIMDHGSPVTWNDIAGLDFVKTTVKEIVVFPLLRPDIFHGLRGPPKGLLLFGPPGTGKTLIGKCIASQSKSTFFSISASSLTSKWVGEGEKMVRALFAVARVHQPSVVFIDEIDSVLSARSDNEHESSRRIKTEFLIQLDGASTVGEERILVVGATNRPGDLDEAARRRLVKRLYVPLPETCARVQIVKNLLSTQNHILSEFDYTQIGDLTDGYSGADMATLCKEAAMGPIRSLDYSKMDSIQPEDVRSIEFLDFESALRQVKASVSDKDLQNYHDWNEQYGSTGK